jgi:RNA polymerase sigma-70 factor (ECF subfamily)
MSSEINYLNKFHQEQGLNEPVGDTSSLSEKMNLKMPLADFILFAIPYLRKISKGSVPHLLKPRLGESDLVQEAILGAAQSWNQFRGDSPESLKKWLREIFRNRLHNLVRMHVRCKKRSVLLEEPAIAEAAQQSDSVSTVLCNQESEAIDLQRMQATFQLLPSHDQLIVELHSRLGFSFVQISEKLSIPEPTARKRYHRAIRRWRLFVDKAAKGIHD